jgi:hypothetical protein
LCSCFKIYYNRIARASAYGPSAWQSPHPFFATLEMDIRFAIFSPCAIQQVYFRGHFFVVLVVSICHRWRSPRLQAKLEDLTVWDMKKVNHSRKGSKTYTYWMASWREGDRTRNVHLGSTRKIDAEAALQKAKKMKAEAIHVN